MKHATTRQTKSALFELALSLLPLILMFYMAVDRAQATVVHADASPVPHTTRDIPFAAKKTAVMWVGDKTQATVYWEYHMPQNRWRIEYLAPSRAKGRVMIQNGSTIWQWEPARKAVFVTTGDIVVDSSERIVPLLIRNYRIDALSQKRTVAGRLCQILKVTPRHRGKSRWIIWTDKSTGMILRRERYAPDGSYELVSNCTEFRPGQVNPSLFDPKRLPSGKIVNRTLPRKWVSQYALKDWPDMIRPRSLRQGFELHSTTILSERPLTIHLAYSDGLAAVSLFATQAASANRADLKNGHRIRLGNTDAIATMVGSAAAISWSSGRFRYTLVGDASESALAGIARSLLPQK